MWLLRLHHYPCTINIQYQYIVFSHAYEGADNTNRCITTTLPRAHCNIACVSANNCEIWASNTSYHSFHDLYESHENGDTSWRWKHTNTQMAWTNAARQNQFEHTLTSYACRPRIWRYALRTVHIILFTTWAKVTNMTIHRDDGSIGRRLWPEGMQHDRIA